MADIPFARGKVIWLYAIPQLVVIIMLFWLFSLTTEDNMVVLPVILVYWFIVYVLRNSISRAHRQGVALIKKNNFEQAIRHFQQSVAYFEQNSWIDKYRYVTLLSASRMTYREMGLCNIAFSFSQMGRGTEAKVLYNEILQQYPGNGIATTALRMMQSVN